MFGEENVEWTSRDTISTADRLRIRGWDYPPTDELYIKHKSVYQNDLYYNQATGQINWPSNRGFDGEPTRIILQPGTRVDRFGYPGGTFVSPEGIPYTNRALAPGTENKPYKIYEVLKPVEVQSGPIKPWFDEMGGGIQWEFDKSVADLLDDANGVLKEVK